MTKPGLEDGFDFWRLEAEAMEAGWGDTVPYTALLPLVGVYLVLGGESASPTSYAWRRTVLASPAARLGLSHCLERHADDLEDDYPLPIDLNSDGPSLQSKLAQMSVMDGLPPGHTTIAWNEEILARSLGFAVHDDAARFNPLSLTDQGWLGLKNHFRETSDFLEEYK